MRRRALTAATVTALVLLTSATSASAGGSDDPTPYAVTASGLALPAGDTFGEHDHVNVAYTTPFGAGKANLHTGIAGSPGADVIGQDEVSWARIGVPTGACITWVQVSGFNEHFGEGGQSPVCTDVPTPTVPTPDVTPTPTPTETVAVVPTPAATPTASPEVSASATPTVTPVSEVLPSSAASATPSSTTVATAGPTATPVTEVLAAPTTQAGVVTEVLAAGDSSGALAATGSQGVLLILTVGVLLVAGGATTLALRRRARATAQSR